MTSEPTGPARCGVVGPGCGDRSGGGSALSMHSGTGGRWPRTLQKSTSVTCAFQAVFRVQGSETFDIVFGGLGMDTRERSA